MDLILKGITKKTTILSLQGLVHIYAFDLRPKSFNFTSFKNIENLCEEHPHENYRLLLSGIEDIVTIQESFQRVADKNSGVELEFSHNTDLKELEKLELSYAWHFDDKTSLDDIKGAKFLSTIIFSHSYLEKLSVSQKLSTFLSNFKSDDFSHLKFELSLKWDDFLIESIFSYFEFNYLSFEVNFQVEKSYQNPNNELIEKELQKIKKLLLRKTQNDDNTDI